VALWSLLRATNDPHRVGWLNSFFFVGAVALLEVFEFTEKLLLHTLEFLGDSYKRTRPLYELL
jgi:hypothetical protein